MIVNSVKKMHARRNPGLVVSSTAFSQPFSPSMNSASFLSPRLASHRVLLEAASPPPSPSLPSLIPRHGKKPSSASHSRLVKRLLIACCGVTIIVWLGIRHLYTEQRAWTDRYTGDGSEDYEMVGDSFLPSNPSAVIVTDKKEKPKWTVSIPESYDFPLKPAHYREICKQSMELSQHLTENGKSHTKRSMGYYSEDPYYMDVREAQEQGLLPKSKSHGSPQMMDDGLTPGEEEGMMVCQRSLTYAMETVDAGLGNTLMAMWMSYGLAMKEGRAWFYDDTRWPYGNYSTYFTPPPAAGCLPPPKSEIVPCPHNARHIVVSPALISHTFGHAFTYEFEDARKMEVQRQHKIFELARVGYEDLFTLREDDASYVEQRAQKLYEPAREAGGMSIGMHVRRGDRHPYEYQYSKDYLPLDRFVDTARDIFLARLGNSTKSKKNAKLNTEIEARHTSSKMVLASDDPNVYPTPEMGHALRAQDRIVLASKTTLEKTAPKTNPYIDEISGWEGGFFKDVFWSLGQPRTNANDAASAGHEVTQEGSKQAMELRELVGRAYLMDLAVLSQADAVVCTVSSLGCRLMAVMMGWENAIDQGNWKNVDGMFEWRGIMW
ncbi:uncharacterized protein BDZ99DRAFT_508879 [Mytilinidion resinicola]|uniref:Uncharacterized protein n=1 Tax=Mytilinidion resinicola TaxID=574789 RepID=A0A6A6YPH8_9PEZI|nr:uncharacterized protein BDZ99DRAFT_508879 [Mytilinidion resinicola]KAF2810459.1 hypothetical protein BDZ99DRAFT_508879 [Mytilinidion resinicola]